MPRNYHVARADILQSMPGTVDQLVKKSGYHRSTVERWVRRLRKEGGSHIVDWNRPNGFGHFTAVHGAGPGDDAPCTLQPLTPSQDWELAKQRHGIHTLRKKERARYWALQARRGRRDPLLAALFG